ncbi:MAG: carboxypeptidase-like regulatory domain-containing protein [Terriglobia bacterium]
MKRARHRRLITCLLLSAGLLLASPGAVAQEDSARVIRGQVLAENGKPVATAIVHLKNVTTKEQWSVVTNKQGRYQFNDVEFKASYQLYAEWHEKKSRTRSISQFDTRRRIFVNLRLQPLKKSESPKKKEVKENKN